MFSKRAICEHRLVQLCNPRYVQILRDHVTKVGHVWRRPKWLKLLVLTERRFQILGEAWRDVVLLLVRSRTLQASPQFVLHISMALSMEADLGMNDRHVK